MSSLEHNLVCANSLTGIGSVDEGLNALIPDREKFGTSLFDGLVESSLQEAKTLLEDVANADEASKAEAKQAAQAAKLARQAAAKSKMIFDVAIANRNGVVSSGAALTESDLETLATNEALVELLEAIQPAHMPYLFPEVFLRANPGFDALVGNPPWEKLFMDEQRWWGPYLPGLRIMNPAAKKVAIAAIRESRRDLDHLYLAAAENVHAVNRAIARGPFPGIGGAHIDLASAFAWRNWSQLREGGALGQVFPRGTLGGSGLTSFRREILKNGAFESVVFLANSKQWVFESVDSRYTFALTVVKKSQSDEVSFAGPFHEREGFKRWSDNLVQVSVEEFVSWSDTALFPQLQTKEMASTYKTMAQNPRFGESRRGWNFRPIQGDFNSSTEGQGISYENDQLDDPQDVWAGSTFNLWRIDGPIFGRIEKSVIRGRLREKFDRSTRSRKSAYFGMKLGPEELPIDKSRIAFRLISRSTDTRTIIAALIPPGTPLVHSAPVLVRRDGGALEEAFLLGVMCSIPFDWVARRWVELNVTFELLNSFPIPIFTKESTVCLRIAEIAGQLVAKSPGNLSWLEELGQRGIEIENTSDRSSLLAELDGLVAKAYGLTASNLTVIYGTFHRGWSDPERLLAAEAALENWEEAT
tara:strand:- start:8 stop:1933 length:1926 start_codon:yes stop_codon:yes gene_type:complete